MRLIVIFAGGGSRSNYRWKFLGVGLCTIGRLRDADAASLCIAKPHRDVDRALLGSAFETLGRSPVLNEIEALLDQECLDRIVLAWEGKSCSHQAPRMP